MKNIKLMLFAAVLMLAVAQKMAAQSSPNCATASDNDYLTSKSFFNYGNVSNSYTTKTRLNVTVGQPVVGSYFAQQTKGTFGFWSSFLMPPSAPTVICSEGDLEDRVQIDWAPDPLSPTATSFKIYRNGSLLAAVDGETFSFLDFNVIAGKFYTYEVTGVNTFGEGVRGSALGFLNPNGVVTGQVKSFAGNPVPGTIVTLTPTLGTSGIFGGDDMAFAEYNTAYPRSQFTLSTWVKIGAGNNSAAIFDLGSSISKNWWLHTLPAADGKGIRFGLGNGSSGVTNLDYAFPAATANDWHNIAVTYNGASLLLYADGELISTAVAAVTADSIPLFFGQKIDGSGSFTGKMDEVRFFNRQLAQTEIQMFLNRTVAPDMDGLVNYWKFDEGTGSKTFDLTESKQKVYFCGAAFSNDKPNVLNAGMTNEDGFYKIPGINYAAGTTFTARPSKNFYYNQSLEFNGVNQTFATLTDFDLADSSTVELTVKGFDFGGNQCLLNKGFNFNLNLNAGNLVLTLGSTTHNFGALGMGFHRLTFNIEQAGGGASAAVTFYKNGTLVGSHTFSGVPASYAGGGGWLLGKNAAGNYFSGLIDEVAFYNNLLTLQDIQLAANVGTNVAHVHLKNYFAFNEGEGTSVKDFGFGLTGSGTVSDATWSTGARLSQIEPHLYTPSTKFATLNPSVTSVDGVDFIDQSTIPVSGYVRFDGTTCFQKKVEILVNGKSNVPQTFTDLDGKFIIDVEPGANIVLTPKFENHTYSPAFWELEKVSTPVAGILFRNQVKRKVVGQLAGNETCRKSVIPDLAVVKVKVATLNGCYEQVKELPTNGKFEFNGVPPDSVTVSVIQHSNPVIYTFFQNKGGATLDLKVENDTVDFIYLAPPQVQISDMPTNHCGTPMFEEVQSWTNTIKVFEAYDGGLCYLDSAILTIDNGIADTPQFDTLMTGGQFRYKYKSGTPNIVPPYLKNLQVTAVAHDEQATTVSNVVVLGKRARTTTFASASPEIPTLILRDPPGDASSAFMESGETTCQNWSFSTSNAMNHDEEVSLSLGVDLTTSVGVGAEVELEMDATADFGFQHSGSTSNLTTNEIETCVTTTKVISTGDNDLVVGSNMGGDVYVGGAINFIFGITDDLLYDTSTCSYVLDKGLLVFPDGFATTFIYSEYHIKHVVIPNLLTINKPADAARWQAIIDRNTQLKNEAVFQENLSFDGGVTYEQSTSTEVSRAVTNEWVTEFSNGFTSAFGFNINGVGIGAGLNMSWTTTESKTQTSTSATSKTVGFTLADDDIGDNFTVNVLKDRAYGTPVFKLVSGQSQCPHEPGTQPRESNSIAADAQVAVNVPMNDVAVFKLALGNTSQSEEMKFYTLEGLQENNPDGAVIRFNGQAALNVGVPFGEPIVVTMTVARGPVEFDYEDLRIGYFSDCEVGRADALGIDPPAEQNKELSFDVYFLEPCSPVGVGFPLQDWVVLTATGPTMNITIDSYNKADADLELIRVQYRRSQGDGAWINIAEISKADLGPVFTIVPWATSTYEDGFYEIRAVTQCFSGALNPGISHVIKGKFERAAPELFGEPEPADGVYSRGDEISIRFNEDIRCDQLIQADFFDNNNIGLYNSETDQLVDAIISCSGDKIVLVPNVPNRFLENKVLRVEIDNIKDLAGNAFVHTQWEFVNDRNNLNWVDNVDVYVAKYVEDIKSVTRRIENRGGFNQDFEITGIPAWARIFPASGTLTPGQVVEVTFQFDSTMVFGAYKDTIRLEGALGNEPLVVEARVVCHKPEWIIDPNAFAYSSNIVLELDIEGYTSTDIEDVVAAYIGNQLRGTAKVQYVPSVDKYLAFLTVYSNDLTGGDINIQIWDASACALFGEVLENFTFTADDLIGSPQVPQVVHTNSLLLRKIPLKAGWNWISFNLAFPNPSPNVALASMQIPTNDLIKSQTQFSQNYPQLGWLGSLTALGNTSMYQLRTANVDTISMVGTAISPASVNIPIVAGWNWIGYVPQTPMTVGEALSALAPLNGDLIKSQTEFAQYVAGFGWIGNLVYMQAPNGYLLKMAQPGTITYPANKPVGATKPRDGESAVANHWTVNPANYELNSTLIGILQSTDGQNVTHETLELGAFVNGEVRGSAKAMFVEPLNAYMFFLTTYANTPGELVTFKLFDSTTATTKDLSETLYFSADAQHGTVQAPFTFGSGATGLNPFLPVSVNRGYLDVQPNPVHDKATFRYSTGQTEDAVLTISDALGKILVRTQVTAQSGENTYFWNGHTDAGLRLPSGVYFVKVEGSKSGVVLDKKVVMTNHSH